MANSPATVDLLELDPDFLRNPYPVYAALRERGPVHHIRTPDGFERWLVVGYEAARTALTDPRITRDFRQLHVTDADLGTSVDSPTLTHMLLREPPDHTRLRRLVAREFSPRRIAALAPRIQEITDELLDAMLANDTAHANHADLIAALAYPLPMAVICELLGVPELDRDAFRAWSNQAVSSADPAVRGPAFDAIGHYMDDLIRTRRKTPGNEDDLLSALIHTVDEGGDRLSGDELIGMALLLLIAGHETTVNLIGNGVRALFAHPDQLALLRSDPGLLDGAIEEMLRYDGPVQTATPRWTTEDVELDGTVVPAGDVVMVALADADRSSERFDDPGRFDIRRDARGHIAFGHGLHYCLGAPLARLEGRIALGSLLARCPNLAPAADERELSWITGMLMRGVKSLPVRW